MDRQKNPFEFPEDIDNGRDFDKLSEILKENKAKNKQAAVGKLDLNAAIDHALENLLDDEPVGSFDRIPNRELQDLIDLELQGTHRLVQRIGQVAPYIDEMEKAGVNFLRLAQIYETMKTNKMEPRFVFAPSYGKPAYWYSIYEKLTDAGSRLQNNPLKPDRKGMYLNGRVKVNWHNLDRVPKNTPFLHVKKENNFVPAVDWTARVVATSDEIEGSVNLPHNSNVNYMTIPEYLTLQGTNIQRGEEPIDGGLSKSWLNGEIQLNTDSVQVFTTAAPYGVFDPMGHVHISYHDIRDIDRFDRFVSRNIEG